MQPWHAATQLEKQHAAGNAVQLALPDHPFVRFIGILDPILAVIAFGR
jgi:hypothetical protein